MNKKDIEALNEAYDKMLTEAIKLPAQHIEKPGIEEVNPEMYGMPMDEYSGPSDAQKWIKLIRKEIGIGPKDEAGEVAVANALEQPISSMFAVSPVKGAKNPGISIRFDDGTSGPAFFVTKRSTVAEILAATYKKYPDVFEKVAEYIVASSGKEYEGM